MARIIMIWRYGRRSAVNTDRALPIAVPCPADLHLLATATAYGQLKFINVIHTGFFIVLSQIGTANEDTHLDILLDEVIFTRFGEQRHRVGRELGLSGNLMLLIALHLMIKKYATGTFTDALPIDPNIFL
jgi:hypothetical protein